MAPKSTAQNHPFRVDIDNYGHMVTLCRDGFYYRLTRDAWEDALRNPRRMYDLEDYFMQQFDKYRATNYRGSYNPWTTMLEPSTPLPALIPKPDIKKKLLLLCPV